MTETPEVSIVVPVHNEGKWLYLTLEAIRSSTKVPTEIVVVDGSSTDSCCSFLRSKSPPFDNITLITQEKTGISRARNAGARNAKAPALVFLDAHCFPQPGSIEGLLHALERNGKGIVAPCISVVGNPQVKGFGMALTRPPFTYYWLNQRAEVPYEIPIACGCCLAMKKDFFFEIGEFDEMRTYGIEDMELSLRCWLLGYSVEVVPTMEVAHRFKEKFDSPVSWEDYLYNALRMALLHFDSKRLARILDHFSTQPSFAQATKNVLLSNIWERYSYLKTKRKFDVEWFCNKFAIDI